MVTSGPNGWIKEVHKAVFVRWRFADSPKFIRRASKKELSNAQYRATAQVPGFDKVVRVGAEKVAVEVHVVGELGFHDRLHYADSTRTPHSDIESLHLYVHN